MVKPGLNSRLEIARLVNKSNGKQRDSKTRALTQLVAMQHTLFLAALKAETKPLERASCARAWKELEAQRQILLGRPLPGSLRPESKVKKSKPKLVAWVDCGVQVSTPVPSSQLAEPPPDHKPESP
jgi:hypothetical protein